jgi:hypothetical protein
MGYRCPICQFPLFAIAIKFLRKSRKMTIVSLIISDQGKKTKIPSRHGLDISNNFIPTQCGLQLWRFAIAIKFFVKTRLLSLKSRDVVWSCMSHTLLAFQPSIWATGSYKYMQIDSRRSSLDLSCSSCLHCLFLTYFYFDGSSVSQNFFTWQEFHRRYEIHFRTIPRCRSAN